MTAFALIDGDIVAYRCAATHESKLDWGDGDETTADFDAAAADAGKVVREWTEQARCETPIVCLTAKTNFRRIIYPRYKSNRSGIAKPIALQHVKDHLAAAFKTFVIEGLEADDVMGLLATGTKYADSVIVSTDKDMRTLPATLFNPTKDLRPRRTHRAEADLFWMTQTLTGDTTDGYPGCPGIGPKKAATILNAAPVMPAAWAAVRDTYLDRGLTADDALTQARLARILRHGDYNRQTGEIALWHPTSPSSFRLSSAAVALC